MPQRLGLTGKASAVFAYVADDLRRDDALRAQRPLWRLPDGPDYDDAPPDDRLVIRLSPKVTRSNRIAVLGGGRTLSEKTLRIEVEVKTPGTSPEWSDQANAWDAIERRIVRRAEQLTAKIEADAEATAAGVFDIECDTPADWGQTGTITVLFHQES